ncbi:MAG TPA: DEAD/DEAH box helicase [Gemmatimonadaceae bacterium]|nr:DEAD/DEAH box helicase [Gemmatimonadaceae bacterium]
MNIEGLRLAALAVVCRTIATTVLPSQRDAEPALGRIHLRNHQVEAVRRGRAAIAEFGGVLVADAVGLGKTYTAIGIARDAQHLGVVAPASLCPMWRKALVRCGRDARVVSHESLSRSRSPGELAGVTALIVDEAHHARNPLTRRYAVLSRIAAGAEVVLLSATPIHNRRRDLHALLALFLGAKAELLDDADLARCIVRREHADSAGDSRRPPAEPLRWLALSGQPTATARASDRSAPRRGDSATVLAALLALPAPWPLEDDRRDAHALVRLGLVRRWASSDAALRASLRRRLVDAEAMLAALADGRRPTRDELRLWTGHDDAVQLSFTSLVVSAPAPAGTTLVDAIHAHARGVRDAISALDTGPNLDAARAGALDALRHNHPGVPIIAFSTYARTVEALWHAMPDRSAVAALTADGAVIAGGRLTRDEALRRFAPLAAGVPAPPRAQSITLLLATDLLAEGLDLRDAGVVVHLDLPWTGARLEQRVGRARRPSSPHDSIAVYALQPPARAEKLLHLLEMLRHKSSLSHHVLGGDGWVTMLGAPARGETASEARRSGAEVTEEIRSLLKSWDPVASEPGARGSDCSEPATGAIGCDRVITVVPSLRDGFIAVLDAARHGGTMLVANGRGGCHESPPLTIARLHEMNRRLRTGRAAPELDPEELASRTAAAVRGVRAWNSAVAALDAAHPAGAGRRDARARLLADVSRTVALSPRTTRAQFAAAADRARAAIARARGAGADQLFAALENRDARDLAWLEDVARLPPSPAIASTGRGGSLRALVLFVRLP